MMGHRFPLVLLVLSSAGVMTGCEDKEFHPPDPAERVEEAESRYSTALFDSIEWASSAERIQSGNLVYADECRRCHGPLGRGDTEYARARNLEVPSLVEPDWDVGDDYRALRHRVFTGHPEGMPTWGIGRLSPREIDAVAFYLSEQLREEVTGSTTIPRGREP